MPVRRNPSIGSQYKTEDFTLQLARGHVDSHYGVHILGRVPAMSQNSSGSIWDLNDTYYPWSAWATPGVLTIPAVNASDNGKIVHIFGLDENYLEIDERIVVSSTAAVTTTNIFSRLNYAHLHSLSTAVGNISIQIASTTIARINAGAYESLCAQYTIPAGKTGYIMQGACTCSASADASVYMRIRHIEPAHPTELHYDTTHTFEVSGTGGQYYYKFTVPPMLSEKTDIDLHATVRSNNARVTAVYDLILIDN